MTSRLHTRLSRATAVVSTTAALTLAGACMGAGSAHAASVSTWEKVAQCESSGNWSINTGNGYYGGLQFSLSTWDGYGGSAYAAYPNQASEKQQILIGEKVLAAQGQDAWPNCGPAAGLGADHADPYPSTTPTPDSAPTRDINGDGHDDLVAVNAATGHLQAFYGNGTAGYTLGPDFGAGWGAYSDITDAGDLNGDGRADLVAVNNATGHLQAFYGNGTGGYTLGPDLGAGWGAYSDITNAGDLNGDGRPDLVAVNNATGHLQAFYSNGTAGYTLGPDFGAGWGAYSSITNAGDLNGDGHDDLVAVNTATGHLQAFYGNGTAGYSFGPDFGAGWGAYGNLTDAGDINGDGHDDLVGVNTATGHLQAFYGNGTAGYTPVAPTSARAGAPTTTSPDPRASPRNGARGGPAGCRPE
ncbi:hypothetical protein GXW82_35735 [Streptacidiphilus sp. 4-A2]|nr:hypothetical protein [Streptacidiphilus sp. 4-A2]